MKIDFTKVQISKDEVRAIESEIINRADLYKMLDKSTISALEDAANYDSYADQIDPEIFKHAVKISKRRLETANNFKNSRDRLLTMIAGFAGCAASNAYEHELDEYAETMAILWYLMIKLRDYV